MSMLESYHVSSQGEDRCAKCGLHRGLFKAVPTCPADLPPETVVFDPASYQQQAVTFAIYSHRESLVYPALGLADEVAECVDKLLDGSMFRFIGDREVKEAMGKELGDVLWYLSALLRDAQIKLSDVWAQGLRLFNDEELFDLNDDWREWVTLVARTGPLVAAVKKYRRGDLGIVELQDRLRQRAPLFIAAWLAAIRVFGLSVENVSQWNIEKLTSRAERKLIRGDGDDR